MGLESIFQSLYDSQVGTAIRESGTLFPWIESVHVLCITTVVGTIAVVDLRLIGAVWTRRRITEVIAETLPITWIAFVFAAITGSLLFSSNAIKYSHNFNFQLKMALLVVAFVNMLIFHGVHHKTIAQWDDAPKAPGAVRLAGGISLLVWIAVIATARWIGFTMSAF
jgi:hypothetical protein